MNILNTPNTPAFAFAAYAQYNFFDDPNGIVTVTYNHTHTQRTKTGQVVRHKVVWILNINKGIGRLVPCTVYSYSSRYHSMMYRLPLIYPMELFLKFTCLPPKKIPQIQSSHLFIPFNEWMKKNPKKLRNSTQQHLILLSLSLSL